MNNPLDQPDSDYWASFHDAIVRSTSKGVLETPGLRQSYKSIFAPNVTAVACHDFNLASITMRVNLTSMAMTIICFALFTVWAHYKHHTPNLTYEQIIALLTESVNNDVIDIDELINMPPIKAMEAMDSQWNGVDQEKLANELLYEHDI